MRARLRLAALARLADHVRQVELARLAQASATRNAVLDDLAAHDAARAAETADLADARVTEAHGRWRSARRATINTALARETALWLTTRDAAARAVGRADVLAKLAARRR